jgi:O-antigen/teichoic acid export membrane protein
MPKAEFSFSTDHLRADIKGRAIRGSGVTILSENVRILVRIISTMVLARLLAPSDFGLIAMVTTFSLLLQNFGVNGITEAIIQREDIDHRMISTLFWLNGGISLGLTLLFMAIAPLIVLFYKEPRLAWITIAISFSILASGLSTIHLALLTRNMQFSLLSGIRVISMLISVVIAVLMAWVGLKYWALVANTVALPLTMAICAWVFCKWRPGRAARHTGVFPMVKYALHTYGNFATHYFSRNLDNVLIGKSFGVQSLGYYKKAYDLFALSVDQLTAPLANVALATLSRFSHDLDKFRKYYLDTVSLIAFIGMALSLVLTVAARDIILVILGPQWVKSIGIFMLFGPGVGIMLIYSTHGWLHLSLGRADRWFRWGIFEFVATATLFVIGIRFGPSGVAVAWTVSFCVLTGPGLWYAGRPAELRISAIFSTIWRYLASAVITGLLSWFVLFTFPPTAGIYAGLNILFRICISFVLCLLLYVSLTIAFYQSVRPVTRLIALVREMLPARLRKRSE